MTLLASASFAAETFRKSPIAPELGVDVLNRTVARERLGRDLFSNPYAAVTIGLVDVYSVFPYLEARTFEVVSDPRWNRLVYGEAGRTLRAFDGRGTTLGDLSQPRGLAVDDARRVYVADCGNDRIVVLQASTEFDEISLTPLYSIGGLSGPYDVAWSDGGTPFVSGDDVLYVADTGKNRVVAFALESAGARQVAALGDLGSGPGCFAGPMAVATGRSEGASSSDVYVADAHNRRIVRLQHDASGLHWLSDQPHDADVLTSLDADQWGNLYAAAPNRGVVRKFNAELAPVAELRGGVSRPKSFHVPFLTVRDHRDGRTVRVGQPDGLLIEDWSDASGAARWSLGVEVVDLAVVGGDQPTAHFTLTDHAELTLEVADASSGRTWSRRTLGPREAGAHTIVLGAEDLRGAGGELVLRVSAASGYEGGPSASAQTRFSMSGGGGVPLPSQPSLMSNTPNPFTPATRIAFLLPANGAEGATLRVFDPAGRLVRRFDGGFSPGFNEVVWDGTNERGGRVSAGVYIYRLEMGGIALTRRMVLVR
jgi:hypothetical protein